MRAYDFVAIDFETATTNYDSACSIGIAAVQNNKVTETFYSLLKPPSLAFDQKNIAIHGITPEMVKHSPTLDDIWHKILPFFSSSLIVAHNAYFDVSVLKRSLYYNELPNFKYVDSVSIAKEFVPGSKSLDHCVSYFGVKLANHHNALDDAVACANVVLCCLAQSGLSNIGQLCFAKESIKIHQVNDLETSEKYYVSSKKISVPSYSSIKPKDIQPTCDCFDCEHPLYQKNIVFTGELKIDRKDAMQLAANVGAVIKSSVSSKTNYLVVGTQDLSLVGEDGMSTKEEKAYELNNQGKADIKIIGEEDFLALIHQGEKV